MKWIIIVAFLHSQFAAYCQDSLGLRSYQDTISRLTSLIKKDELLSSPSIGIGGSASKPFYRFLYLLSLAKTEDLVAMTRDTSPYLRVYGYIGLLHREHSDTTILKRKFFADTDWIETISGCNMATMSVAEVIKNTSRWYNKQGFDSLLKERISPDYVSVYSKKMLLVE